MLIHAVSDLHGHTPELPGGDLLIIAGDFTAKDDFQDWHNFSKWMNTLEYKKIILIAGNHDNMMAEFGLISSFGKHIEYLEDRLTEFEGIKIWGSPWTIWFPEVNPRCSAFMLPDDQLTEKWAKIPENLDILVTHSPPYRVLDLSDCGTHCGSKTLLEKVDNWKHPPKYHIFGHIHEQGGKRNLYKYQGPNTWCHNVSYVDEHYNPRKNSPMLSLTF